MQGPTVPLVIVGVGSHARVLLDLAGASGRQVVGLVRPAGAADRREASIASSLTVLGSLVEPDEWLASIPGAQFAIALGDNHARQAAYGRCMELGLEPATLIHPSAVLLGGAIVEPGAQVCATAVVGVDAHVESDAILNTAATVDHDCRIGPHSFVGPGAHLAGNVTVDTGAHIGIGAVVRQGSKIGAWSLVAAGAAVVADVPPHRRVAGVPAKPMQPSPDQPLEEA
jgi:acetyltransferase EpsM